ncbi:MAG: hypothetical protein JWP44_4938 [Mucilaginibacter sp.]|nr:hypothetical protein [Mucilaginibacter sp.]
MIRDKILGQHSFKLNPYANGGESIILTTTFIDNGNGVPKGIYTNQELTLHSNSNSAQLNLGVGVFHPKILRKLADELDNYYNNLK